MIHIIFIIISVLFFFYGILLLVPGFVFAFSKKDTALDFIPKTFVSILVPVRNEEDTIVECLKSLSMQDYPKEKFEIILINDHSTDKTKEIAERFAKDFSQLKVMDNLPQSLGKKSALTLGVNAARGELIATTDGDCIIPSKWLNKIVKVYQEDNAVFIAGPVAYKRQGGIFRHLLQIEQIVLQLISGGAMKMGFPLMCSGANLAYRKDFFMACGGYENDIFASGDDMMLMLKAQKKYPGKQKFISDPEAIVLTKSADGFAEAIQQRSRWISKFSTYKNLWITGTGIVVIMSNLFVVFLGIFSLCKHMFVDPFIWAFVLKMLIDLLLLSLAVPFFREPRLFLFALLEELFYPFLAICAAIARLSGSFSWKGRDWKT